MSLQTEEQFCVIWNDPAACCHRHVQLLNHLRFVARNGDTGHLNKSLPRIRALRKMRRSMFGHSEPQFSCVYSFPCLGLMIKPFKELVSKARLMEAFSKDEMFQHIQWSLLASVYTRSGCTTKCAQERSAFVHSFCQQPGAF